MNEDYKKYRNSGNLLERLSAVALIGRGLTAREQEIPPDQLGRTSLLSASLLRCVSLFLFALKLVASVLLADEYYLSLP